MKSLPDFSFSSSISSRRAFFESMSGILLLRASVLIKIYGISNAFSDASTTFPSASIERPCLPSKPFSLRSSRKFSTFTFFRISFSEIFASLSLLMPLLFAPFNTIEIEAAEQEYGVI
ncbi:MAG: hypothetical protein A2017_13990 [Lentisphaerae bacterium GWF2_44_16]|nr:MAG: hypothetical protein A2017_13990 [Lentisphaerae bacterium GWF2_44_16]